MAQHIGIIKVNERGETIDTLEVNFAEVVNILEDIDNSENNYPWITTVDPYGDTIFNRIQIPFVIEDLKTMKNIQELAQKDDIDKLINFLEGVDIHQYIKFMGD